MIAASLEPFLKPYDLNDLLDPCELRFSSIHIGSSLFGQGGREAVGEGAGVSGAWSCPTVGASRRCGARIGSNAGFGAACGGRLAAKGASVS